MSTSGNGGSCLFFHMFRFGGGGGGTSSNGTPGLCGRGEFGNISANAFRLSTGIGGGDIIDLSRSFDILSTLVGGVGAMSTGDDGGSNVFRTLSFRICSSSVEYFLSIIGGPLLLEGSTDDAGGFFGFIIGGGGRNDLLPMGLALRRGTGGAVGSRVSLVGVRVEGFILTLDVPDSFGYKCLGRLAGGLSTSTCSDGFASTFDVPDPFGYKCLGRVAGGFRPDLSNDCLDRGNNGGLSIILVDCTKNHFLLLSSSTSS